MSMHPPRKAIFWLAALLAAGFILRCAVSMIDIVRLVQICLADDAFNYFRIAKNIAAGYGATADRIHATNGFHPLYMIILVPIFKIFGQDLILPIRIALVTLSIFNTLTAVYIYKILRRLCNGEVGIFGAAFYLFNPATIFTCLTGVEAAIATFFIAAATDALLQIKSTESPSLKDTLRLGAFLGLALVARTDSIIFCGCVFLDRIICTVRNSKKEWMRLFTLPALTVFIVAPWLIWNMARFHAIQQDSGKTIQFMSHRLLENAYPASQYSSMFLNSIATTMSKAVIYLMEFYLPIDADGPLFILFLVALMAAWVMSLQRNNALKQYLANLYPLFLTVAGIFVFYTIFFLFCQRWYFMSSYFIGSLIWGPALWYIKELFATLFTSAWLKRLALTAIGSLLALCFCRTAYLISYIGFNPWQALYIQAGQFIEERLPDDVRVGAFNSGIVSYFTNKKVINLDGVVNSDIYQVLRDRQLVAYIRKNNIDFVLDHPLVFTIYENYSDAPFGGNFELFKKFKSTWWGLGDVLIYKIKKGSPF